jgi:hypothetical protein
MRPLRSLSSLPPEQDLAVARAAVSEFLGRGGSDSSMPWENPRTGARGTITPIASAYNQDGATCRDFLASYVRDGNEAWMQGEACRIPQGKWEVRTLKPGTEPDHRFSRPLQFTLDQHAGLSSRHAWPLCRASTSYFAARYQRRGWPGHKNVNARLQRAMLGHDVESASSN